MYRILLKFFKHGKICINPVMMFASSMYCIISFSCWHCSLSKPKQAWKCFSSLFSHFLQFFLPALSLTHSLTRFSLSSIILLFPPRTPSLSSNSLSFSSRALYPSSRPLSLPLLSFLVPQITLFLQSQFCFGVFWEPAHILTGLNHTSVSQPVCVHLCDRSRFFRLECIQYVLDWAPALHWWKKANGVRRKPGAHWCVAEGQHFSPLSLTSSGCFTPPPLQCFCVRIGIR